MAKKQTNEDNVIVTTHIEEGQLGCWLVGKTPIVLNRLAEKAKHELLLPKVKGSRSGLKHNPPEEYRASAHTISDESAPTLLAFPAAGPKRAIASAAIDMPGGAKKAQIGRLCWVPGQYRQNLPLYGTPQLFTCVVRTADMNHTPDMRTRVIVPQWALRMSVNFAKPMVNVTVLLNLLSAAGMYIGLGDGRPEKGALTFGQFRVLSDEQAKSDTEVQKLLKQGRKIQQVALAKPEYYDEETCELLEWYYAELRVRGTKELLEDKEAA
jgi:hypothetical protein